LGLRKRVDDEIEKEDLNFLGNRLDDEKEGGR